MAKKVNWTDAMKQMLRDLYEIQTWEQISNSINDYFKVNTTPNMVRKAHERYRYDVLDLTEQEKPKILLFDIETMPMEFYAWSLRQKYLSLDMMKEDWSVLSYAAKWLDQDEIFYESIEGQKNQRDDRKILKKIWKLLDEADIVVGHNSDAFDIKKLNARFIMNGMQRPSKYKKMDTCKMARKNFGFTSNKLSYLTSVLCTEHKKSDHNEFPGFKMWLECINKNKRAFNTMKEYNMLDVTSLEELFKKMLPWENAGIFNLYTNGEPKCSCGSTKFKRIADYRTNACVYERHRCTNCGAEYRGTHNIRNKEREQMLDVKG